MVWFLGNSPENSAAWLLDRKLCLRGGYGARNRVQKNVIEKWMFELCIITGYRSGHWRCTRYVWYLDYCQKKARPQLVFGSVRLVLTMIFPDCHINPLSNMCTQRYVSECAIFGPGSVLMVLSREKLWRNCIIRGRTGRMGTGRRGFEEDCQTNQCMIFSPRAGTKEFGECTDRFGFRNP